MATRVRILLANRRPHGEFKKNTALLDELKAGEATLVLRRLLGGHPELLSEAVEILRSTLGEVSFESIASEPREGGARSFGTTGGICHCILREKQGKACCV